MGKRVTFRSADVHGCRTNDATDARYVRFYATAWTVEWESGYLAEFEVYE